MGLFDNNDETGRLSGMAKAIDKASNSPEAFRPVGATSNAPLDIRPPAAQPSWFDNLRGSQFWSSIPMPFQNMFSSMYDHFGQMGNQAQPGIKQPQAEKPQTQPPATATRSSLLPPAIGGTTQQPQLSKTSADNAVTQPPLPTPAVLPPQLPPQTPPVPFPQLPPLPQPQVSSGAVNQVAPPPPIPVGGAPAPATTPFSSQADWGAPVNQISGI